MERAGFLVGKMAANDLDMILRTRDRIHEIMENLEQTNTLISTRLRDISNIADKIGASVGVSLQSLQFEDILRQLTESASMQLRALQPLVDGLNQVAQHLLNASPGGFRDAFQQASLSLDQSKTLAETLRVNTKPVSQESVEKGGSIAFF